MKPTPLKTVWFVALFVAMCLVARALMSPGHQTLSLERNLSVPRVVAHRSFYEIAIYVAGGLVAAILLQQKQRPTTHLLVLALHVACVTLGSLIAKGQWPKLSYQPEGA